MLVVEFRLNFLYRDEKKKMKEPQTEEMKEENFMCFWEQLLIQYLDLAKKAWFILETVFP